MQILAAGSKAALGPRGFTLLELLVVVAIMALATAGVSLSLRDPSETQLEREAERLAALLDGARAKARAVGVPVRWRPVEGGFRFEGLPASAALPTQWLDTDTRAFTPAPLVLGPEPLIAPQTVVLSQASHPERRLQVGTDGLRPFTVQGAP
ncbi:MAG: prepilin-type N-terminal cleavage/methylation domain-containing protein [Giesbergeria sp.]